MSAPAAVLGGPFAATTRPGRPTAGRVAVMPRVVTERRATAAFWWTLRVGAFLCFVGHGAFGVLTKEAWVPFFAVAGIGREAAFRLMPLVGGLDILVGVLTLVRPRAAVIAYLVLWALWTAALRPLTGMPMWEMLERAGNYGVPLALLLLVAPSSVWGRARPDEPQRRGWFAPAAPRPLTASLARHLRVTLAVTTAVLLLGHGALAVSGKPELVAHAGLAASALLSGLAPAFGPADVTALAAAAGWLEIGLAALVLWRPSVGLCLAIAGWKLATESLFLVAGAPIWEVVERGGSYAAPLALAMLVWLSRRRAERSTDTRW